MKNLLLFQTSMAADSHKELQVCRNFGDWIRNDIQYSSFQNYELTYAHFVRFPSWGLSPPGLSPGSCSSQDPVVVPVVNCSLLLSNPPMTPRSPAQKLFSNIAIPEPDYIFREIAARPIKFRNSKTAASQHFLISTKFSRKNYSLRLAFRSALWGSLGGGSFYHPSFVNRSVNFSVNNFLVILSQLLHHIFYQLLTALWRSKISWVIFFVKHCVEFS